MLLGVEWRVNRTSVNQKTTSSGTIGWIITAFLISRLFLLGFFLRAAQNKELLPAFAVGEALASNCRHGDSLDDESHLLAHWVPVARRRG